MNATAVPTGTMAPSAAEMFLMTPSAGASISIAALSVSISKSSAPFLIVSPSLTCHLEILPVAMSISTLGMMTSVAMDQILPRARLRTCSTMFSICGTAAFSRTGL